MKPAAAVAHSLTQALGVIALFACLLPSCHSGTTPPERIILVVIDTLRADRLGAYGGALETPNFDLLTERSQVFPNALASFHQTSMSMASIFTGLTPSLETADPLQPLEWNRGNRCGMSRFRRQGDDACLPSALETLAEDLSAAGYWTAGVTANPLLFRPAGYDQGFDRWSEVGIVPGGKLNNMSFGKHARSRAGEHVNQAVAELLEGRPTDHFFLYVHYLDVHDWYLLKRTYDEGVEIQDRVFGDLMQLLGTEGLLDGATLILTADHGEHLGERHPTKPLPTHLGNPTYEEVLRVPLIVAPPFDEVATTTLRGSDLRSLIRRIVGLETPPSATEPDELFVSELEFQTYREDRYKSMWPRKEGPPLLFDLATDGAETGSIAESEQPVLDRHRARLDALTRELGASLGEGLDNADREEDLQRLRVLGYIE